MWLAPVSGRRPTSGFRRLHEAVLDAPGWRDIPYDLTARLDVAEAELRRRLETRWHWMTPEARADKIDGNDLPNPRLMREGSRTPDVVLT